MEDAMIVNKSSYDRGFAYASVFKTKMLDLEDQGGRGRNGRKKNQAKAKYFGNFLPDNPEVLCCVVLCCGVLWCAVLCCIVLWCGVLWCVVLCCGVLWCVALCCVVLCCTVMCCAVLCCAVLCCAVLCCAVLYCAVVCCSLVSPAFPQFDVCVLLCVMFIVCDGDEFGCGWSSVHPAICEAVSSLCRSG